MIWLLSALVLIAAWVAVCWATHHTTTRHGGR